MVQLDRGVEIGVRAVPVADRVREQCVHLGDIERFARWRAGCGESKPLRHCDGRQRVALRPGIG